MKKREKPADDPAAQASAAQEPAPESPAQGEDLATQVAELQAEKRERDAGDRINLALRQGRVTAAELDAEEGFLRGLAADQPKTFDKLMATRPEHPELFTEKGSDQDTTPEGTVEDIFRLAREKQAANEGMSFDAARDEVLRERPDLEALTRKEA